MPDVLPPSGGKTRFKKHRKPEGCPASRRNMLLAQRIPILRAEFEACFALPAQRAIKCIAVESEKLRQIIVSSGLSAITIAGRS